MDDRARVAAILADDPAGLADCFDAYAGRLLSFCTAMLHDRSAAEDAVQDTFVVLAQRVGQLRDPDRLRPWLYAVARALCLRQIRDRTRLTPTDDIPERADDSVNPGTGLEQEQLRELVWQAARGLNAGERAALELSLRHGLAGEELAAALGVPRGTVNKLLQRAREQLERGLTVLLLTRPGGSSCADLRELVQGWDGQLTVLVRKRVSRHVAGCEVCSQARARTVSATSILGGTPLLLAPAALRRRVLERSRMVSDDYSLARRAGHLDRSGFPVTEGDPARLRYVLPALTAVLVLVVTLVLVLVPRRSDPPLSGGLPSLSLGGVSPILTGGPGAQSGVPGRLPSSSSPTASPPGPPATSSTSASGSAPSTSGSAPSTTSASSPTTPTTPPTTPQGAVVLTVSPGTLELGPGSSGVLVLSAAGGASTWKSQAPPGLTLTPASGTLPAGGKVQVRVDLNRAVATGQPATVTFGGAGSQARATVSWQ